MVIVSWTPKPYSNYSGPYIRILGISAHRIFGLLIRRHVKLPVEIATLSVFRKAVPYMLRFHKIMRSRSCYD